MTTLRSVPIKTWVALGAALIAGGICLVSLGSGTAVAARAVALAVIAVTLFATRVLPDIVTAFTVLLLALASATAPPEVIFSGFSTGGFWLLFSGVVLGSAVASTGVAERLAQRLLGGVGRSWPWAVLLLALVAFFLGILIPSTIPRVIVMMPVALALGRAMGFGEDSRESLALAGVAATATLLPTYGILTANLPTIVHAGALETLYGEGFTYTGYALEQLPVNLLRLVLIIVAMSFFVRGPSPRAPDRQHVSLTQPQTRLLAILAGAIVLWWLDFAHGIAPAWIAMVAALLVLWPALGVLDGKAMRNSIDLTPVILLAAIFAVSAILRHVGVDQALADALISRLDLGQHGQLWDVYAVFFVSLVVSHVTTAPAAPLVLAPFAGPLAEASGLPRGLVASIQVIGIATPIIPYQAPPLLIAMSLANVPAGLLFRLCLFLAAGVILVGLPLSVLWWRMTGLL